MEYDKEHILSFSDESIGLSFRFWIDMSFDKHSKVAEEIIELTKPILKSSEIEFLDLHNIDTSINRIAEDIIKKSKQWPYTINALEIKHCFSCYSAKTDTAYNIGVVHYPESFLSVKDRNEIYGTIYKSRY